MLTQSELAWLTQRGDIEVACDSYRVPGLDDGYDLEPDLQDALEFSERVAAKLAEAYGTMLDHNEKHSLCQTCRFEVVKTLGCMSTCAETVLRWAQLEVEGEMDAE